MGLSVIRVSFSRQANDGDYGSETARAYVHAELSKSPNWKVRHAVQEPEHAEALQPAEDDREDLPY